MTNNAPPLFGEDCQCPTCGLTFVGERAFDRHRVGEYGLPRDHAEGRRCRNITEMEAAGMRLNSVGQWRIPRSASPLRTEGNKPHGVCRPTGTAGHTRARRRGAVAQLEAA